MSLRFSTRPDGAGLPPGIPVQKVYLARLIGHRIRCQMAVLHEVRSARPRDFRLADKLEGGMRSNILCGRGHRRNDLWHRDCARLRGGSFPQREYQHRRCEQ